MIIVGYFIILLNIKNIKNMMRLYFL